MCVCHILIKITHLLTYLTCFFMPAGTTHTNSASIAAGFLPELPRAGSGVVRIDPFRFLAGCRTRRLNQALLAWVYFECVCCAVNYGQFLVVLFVCVLSLVRLSAVHQRKWLAGLFSEHNVLMGILNPTQSLLRIIFRRMPLCTSLCSCLHCASVLADKHAMNAVHRIRVDPYVDL